MSSGPYIKVSSYEAKKGEFDKCLLLYSGGLDTSCMLRWIPEHYGCEIYALIVDIGQTADNLQAIHKKALDLGAIECIIYDAKEEFADQILSQCIKANGNYQGDVYQGGYHLGCPLGRVIISQVAVKVAARFGCQVIAHGCTGRGNDQVRFDSYIITLNPSLKIIAPVREWGMGREEEIYYAKKNNIPIEQTKSSPFSYDENMWSNTGEGGIIEDIQLVAPVEKILKWCNPIDKTPDIEETILIEFDRGIPVSLDGKYMKLYDIIKAVNKIGSKHGVGVVQLIEDRIVGLKVRGIYENPGAAILIAAHKKLEMLVSTREENELSQMIQNKWSYLVYGAQWFHPLMGHLNAYINHQNDKISGTVTVSLYRGNITVVALTSPSSLFNPSLATFERNNSFNTNASASFIELYSLPMRTAYNLS